ncbi:hypothetical protein [Dyadobacter sandarakinus]|uniref:Ig-like domain-containing protein n=1 Tax=Dyadobacter sandarakinus TaxID=2747268 RepID=A0ABX7I0J8_9BACT|nr:hypothetical protein [Dyadobacter sandarakinus]QRQ99550.1 hypothetical protein HWI92_00785 [Dyadobacter sandarakinus]
MKKYLVKTLAMLLGAANLTFAQSIPVSSGAAICTDCTAPGWAVFADSHPDLSNTKYCGTSNLSWKFELPSPPSGARTFPTLFVNASATEEIQTTMTGLVVDKHYTLFLHVLSTITGSNTNYPIEAHATFVSGAKSDEPQNSPNQAFTASFGNDKGVWKKIKIRFKALASSAVIRFAGGAQIGSSGGGYLAIDVAKDALVTCNAGTNQVTLVPNPDISYNCISTKVNLNSKVTSSTPNGSKLVWYNEYGNPSTGLGEILNSDAFSLGDEIGPSKKVFAYYYDPIAECLNSPLSSASLTVTGPNEVALKDTVTDATCPDNKGNITQLLDGFPPSGMSTVWYTTSDHSGSKITSPSSSSPGIYYAFHQSIGGCFNTNKSKAKVRVKANPCLVDLTLKVKLQGAMLGNSVSMRNDLQLSNLLPIKDPYGKGQEAASINNQFFVGGKVVDWLLVEIRDNMNPGTVLESQALLLQTSGDVVDLEGKLPKFLNRPKGAIISVKHRNHLAVMSNVISFTVPSAFYDFSAGLNRAYNDPNQPSSPQLVQKNGTWCMWSYDVNQDLAGDATDYNQLFSKTKLSPYDVYSVEDIDMNGSVDATDLNMLHLGSKISPYSILLNY